MADLVNILNNNVNKHNLSTLNFHLEHPSLMTPFEQSQAVHLTAYQNKPNRMDNSNLLHSDFLSIRQRFYSNESLSAHPPERFASGDRRMRRACAIEQSRNKGAKINMGVFY